MKSIKTILTSTLVAALLLISANGALAALSGSFTDGTTTIDLTAGTITIDGTQYSITDTNGTTNEGSADFGYTASDGAGTYIYGIYHDAGTQTQYMQLNATGTVYVDNPAEFAFVMTTTELSDYAKDTLQTKTTTALKNFYSAVNSDLLVNAASGSIYATSRDSLINNSLSYYGSGVLDVLTAAGVTDATLGYGSIADDGSSFGVIVSDSLTQSTCYDLILANSATTYEAAATPIPGAIWLLGSGLAGLIGLRRRMRG